jgi:hypothetical protein
MPHHMDALDLTCHSCFDGPWYLSFSEYLLTQMEQEMLIVSPWRTWQRCAVITRTSCGFLHFTCWSTRLERYLEFLFVLGNNQRVD